MTPENTIKSWTEDQEKVIAMYQQKLGMTRSNAIRKLRGQELRGITAAQILTAPAEPKLKQVQEKPAPKPKAKAIREPKAAKDEHQGKYNKEMVIRLYMEEGKSPSEIAQVGQRDSAPTGIKGISPVYCHRILFGSENSGGISKEQAARRKEQAARVKAWAAEKESK